MARRGSTAQSLERYVKLLEGNIKETLKMSARKLMKNLSIALIVVGVICLLFALVSSEHLTSHS